MQECRDIDQDAGIDIDKQLLSMQIRIEQMAAMVEFTKQVEHAGIDPRQDEGAAVMPNNSFTLNYRQNNNNKGHAMFFDIEDIHNMTSQGIKRHDLSSIIEKYESEYAYIEGLNLKRVVNDVFKTLEKSLSTIQEHTGSLQGESPTKKRHLDFNYDIVQSLTQQRDYLDHFNGRFSRFVTQLLTLFDYSKQKEKMHLTQIESLAEQNQVLFDENCALQKQLQLRN